MTAAAPDDRETRLLRAVAANTPVILWAIDPDGYITYSAGKGLQQLGLRDGDRVGMHVLDLYPPDPHHRETFDRAVAGETFRTEVTIGGPTFETWFQPRHAGDGSLVEVVAVSWDITEAMATREAQREVAEQQRSMLLQMLAAQEAERHELADRMHDDLIQVLASVALRIEMLDRRLDQRGETELSDEVGRLHTAVQDAIQRLRGVLFDLEPPELGSGLSVPLRELASRVLDGTSVAYEVVVPPEPPVAEVTAAVLYRVAAEALSNVARHARAGLVVLTLTEELAGWTLSVADDGQGPGPDGFAERPGHRGLVGMRDRVERAGGRLSVFSQPAGGTEVRAWVPNRPGTLLAGRAPLDLREPLREILDESDEAFNAFDLDWNYVFVNRRAAELSGHTPNELEGKNVWEVFPGAVGSTMYIQCMRAMSEQRVVEFADFRFGRWLENRLLPSKHGLFAYSRDTTEQRRAWQRADHSGDAGALLLSALVDASGERDERARVTRVLRGIVDSRWFTAARVYAADGTVFAEAVGHALPEPTLGARDLTGAQLLSEPLVGGIGGRLELEGQVPAHLAVRWLARMVAALVTPAVRSAG